MKPALELAPVCFAEFRRIAEGALAALSISIFQIASSSVWR